MNSHKPVKRNGIEPTTENLQISECDKEQSQKSTDPDLWKRRTLGKSRTARTRKYGDGKPHRECESYLLCNRDSFQVSGSARRLQLILKSRLVLMALRTSLNNDRSDRFG